MQIVQLQLFCRGTSTAERSCLTACNLLKQSGCSCLHKAGLVLKHLNSFLQRDRTDRHLRFVEIWNFCKVPWRLLDLSCAVPQWKSCYQVTTSGVISCVCNTELHYKCCCGNVLFRFVFKSWNGFLVLFVAVLLGCVCVCVLFFRALVCVELDLLDSAVKKRKLTFPGRFLLSCLGSYI